MAYTDQQVLQWFLDNPNATDAQIAQTAAAAQIPAEQLSRVTSVPVAEIQSRVAAAAPEVQLPSAPSTTTAPAASDALFGNLESTVSNWGGAIDPTVVKLANQILSQGTSEQWQGTGAGSAEANALFMGDTLTKAGITDINQFGQWQDEAGNTVYGNKLTQTPVANTYGERQTGTAWGGTYAGGGNTAYRAEFDESGNPIFYTTEASSNDLAGLLENPLLNIAANVAASYFGGPLGSGLLQIAQGNDLGDAAKAAALTYAAGKVGDYFKPQDSIYSLANGPSNLDYMGGGQGLTSTGAANLASMGGAQGLQILGGLPSTTLAEALSSFGGVNPSVLADMGIGTGITYVTPTGIVTENGTIIGGDVISEFGKNTGFDLTNWLNENIGTGIGDELATIDTGISSGTTTGITTGTTTDTKTDTKTGTEGITVGKVLDGVKLAGVAASLLGAGTGAGETGFGIVPVPSDWTTPTYGQPTGAVQGLPPINFGSPELLRGTQWEKYLNPMQPAIAPAQQTGMGYNQLMNTLQGGQGGSLSLNDIISGIQGQYGQTPTGTAS